MKALQQLMDEIHEWSDKTFGIYRNSRSMIAHLKKEVEELDSELALFYEGCYSEEIFRKRTEKVREEFADCFMLLLDAASHFGMNKEMILLDIAAKLEVNKQRKWGNPDKNGVVEHIRE